MYAGKHNSKMLKSSIPIPKLVIRSLLALLSLQSRAAARALLLCTLFYTKTLMMNSISPIGVAISILISFKSKLFVSFMNL